jgi:hypothetical protein
LYSGSLQQLISFEDPSRSLASGFWPRIESFKIPVDLALNEHLLDKKKKKSRAKFIVLFQLMTRQIDRIARLAQFSSRVYVGSQLLRELSFIP